MWQKCVLFIVLIFLTISSAISFCQETKEEEKLLFFAGSLRYSIDLMICDVELGDTIQTTPAHPDDYWLFDGETTTDIAAGNSYRIGATTAGGDISYGSERLRLTLGLDLRIPMRDDDFRSGIYTYQQQDNDPRPAFDAAFVFTQFYFDSPVFFDAIPHIGLDVVVFKCWKSSISVEYGWPYTGFTARSGHDRYLSWEEVKKENWSGFGKRIEIQIKPIYGFGLSFYREEYDLEYLDEPASLEVIGVTIIFAPSIFEGF
ncbi:MAG: hypothetical protein ABIE68_00810 [bacterium]